MTMLDATPPIVTITIPKTASTKPLTNTDTSR